jgi:hypothetical protein
MATQDSARRIRAQDYRTRAAAVRLRVRALAFPDLRSELAHLAPEYERLAEYLAKSDAHVVPATGRGNS